MSYYHAEIINLSLRDCDQLSKFEVLDITRRFFGLLKIYTVSIPENEVAMCVSQFQDNLSTRLKKEWYITIHNAEQIIVVFRKKVFYLSGQGISPVHQHKLDVSHAKDREKWNEMIVYAHSIGVPDNQCDFLPEGFDQQDYSK